MKKMIIVGIAALFMMGGLHAQTPTKPAQKKHLTTEQMARQRTERLTKNLELNEQQAKIVYEISLNQAEKAKEIKEQQRALHKEGIEKMRRVLTPEQFAKWQEMSKANHGKKAGHGKKGAKCQGKQCQGQQCQGQQRQGR